MQEMEVKGRSSFRNYKRSSSFDRKKDKSYDVQKKIKTSAVQTHRALRTIDGKWKKSENVWKTVVFVLSDSAN